MMRIVLTRHARLDSDVEDLALEAVGATAVHSSDPDSDCYR